MCCVLLPVFMGSVDTTILAGALPTIGRELGQVHALPWLVTAYLIASTAVTPLYGKISDIRGRRVTLATAIAIYMTGSVICAVLNPFIMASPRSVWPKAATAVAKAKSPVGRAPLASSASDTGRSINFEVWPSGIL